MNPPESLNSIPDEVLAEVLARAIGLDSDVVVHRENWPEYGHINSMECECIPHLIAVDASDTLDTLKAKIRLQTIVH